MSKHTGHQHRQKTNPKNKSPRKKFVAKTNDLPVYICPKCKTPITDISSALCDKITGQPVHFDCVIEMIKASENLPENTEITYIGNGQFAVMEFKNAHNKKKFKILKTIKWEEQSENTEWRKEITSLYQEY